MSITQVKQKAVPIGGRAGTQALTLLSTPINVCVLETLAEEPRSLVDLRRAAESPPATTMRGHLRVLTETGVLVKRRQTDFPGAVDYELADSGRDLLAVAEVLRAWLAAAPDGPLPLGSAGAKSRIKALVGGWSTNMIRALAARPLSLTELDSLISSVSYPSLERRLAAMRLAGQVEARTGRGGSTPYAVTEWLRRAIAPLAAATRWEHRNVRDEAIPIGPHDAEAAFLLTIPLLRLAADVSGSCRLAVEIGGGARNRLVGVMVALEGGRVSSCVCRLEGSPSAWAVGPAAAWMAAVIRGEADRLDLGGDHDLGRALLDGFRKVLFWYET